MKNTTLSTILLYTGELAHALSLFVMIVVIARLGTPQELGIFTLFISIITPIYMFLWMQQRHYLVSDSENSYATSSYFDARILMASIALLVSLLLGSWLSPPEFYGVFIALSLVKFIESFSDLSYGVFLRREKVRDISMYKIVRSVVVMIFFFTCYLLTGSLQYSLLVVISASAVILFFELKTVWSVEKGRHSSNLFSSWNGLKIIRETASLGNLELAFSLQVNSPKYILMFLFGEIIVGIFSALLYLYRPSVLFVSSMIQAVSSRLSVLHAGGEDKAVKGLVLKLLTVSFLITAIMAVSYYFFGEWLIVLVFGENFSSYGGILNLVSINYLIAVPVATLSYYGIVRRKYQSQYKIVLFGILSNVVLSLLLGWQFGIKGVLFGWILSSIIILTLYFLSAFGAPQKIGHGLFLRAGK